MKPRDGLDPPPGLVVERFERDGEAFAILEWPKAPPRPRVPLAPAQREVLALLLSGLSNAVIARRRGRATRTVANQVAAIFRRLGVTSRLELFALFARGDGAGGGGP